MLFKVNRQPCSKLNINIYKYIPMQNLDTNQCINLITLILIHTHTNFGINIIACPPLVFAFKQGNKFKNKLRNTQTSV